MTPKAFDRACRALPAVTLEHPWGEHEDVYKVGGRMFAVTGPGGGLSIKVSDIAFEALTESGEARPAPYLARAKWVRFETLAALDDEEVASWLASAHALVSAKLTRAKRREFGLEEAKS